MAKKILVQMNLFNYQHPIYIADTETNKIEVINNVSTDNLKEAIVNQFINQNIEELEIDGQEEYIQKFGLDIMNELTKNYSNRNVRILINGKIFN